MNVSNNISSMQSYQTMLNTSANNIANPNSSTTNLAKEIPNMMIAEDATSVNASAIKTQDEMLGSLLDIKA